MMDESNKQAFNLWDRKRKRDEELSSGVKSVIPISSLLSEPLSGADSNNSFQFEWFGSSVESTPLKTVLSCHEDALDVEPRRLPLPSAPFPLPRSPPRIAIPTPIHPPSHAAPFPVPCCPTPSPPTPTPSSHASSSSSQASGNTQRGMKPQAIRQLEEQLSRLQKSGSKAAASKDPKKVKMHYPAAAPSSVSPRAAPKSKDSCCAKPPTPTQPKEVPSCCSKPSPAKEASSCCSKKQAPPPKKPSCCSSSDASSSSPPVVLPVPKKTSCCSSKNQPAGPKETSSCCSAPKTPVASCCQKPPQSAPNPPPSPLPFDSSSQRVDWGRTDPPEITNTPLSCNCNCSCTSYTKRSCGCACSDSSAGCSCVSTYLLNPNNVLSTLPG
eukprot:TRINITY_DN16513_c0_g1_i1.p1 TRINITY_DN16513_c0_g1~~TRINITY_DN16513_c0_g1_i1.p1  ORF type:complete len:399 (-),score=86.97 TRINITY_DN16513_c0_g1_i1:8-1153(-)